MKKILLILIIALSVISFCSCAREDYSAQEEMFNKVMSADEALEMSMKTDTVVFEMKGCTSGQKVWDEFCAKTAKGKKASVLCANYYVLDLARISRDLYEEEKDYYPQLYFSLIEFDGKNYTVKTRKSDSEELDSEETYKFMLHFTGDAASASAVFESYEYYILADDESLTYDQINRSMFSSRSGDYIRNCRVYTNYTGWKGN